MKTPKSDKIWDVEANLGILIALIILKKILTKCCIFKLYIFKQEQIAQ